MTPKQRLIQAINGFLPTSDTSGTLANVVRSLLALVNDLPDGPSNQPAPLLWVAPNGNDATGQRGNLDRPFRQVQAAIDAAQPQDTILIAPGDYDGVVVPSGRSLTLQGLGNERTPTVRIFGTNEALLWDSGPADRLAVQNVQLLTFSAVTPALLVTGIPDLVNAELYLDRVQYGSALGIGAQFSDLGYLQQTNCDGFWSCLGVSEAQTQGHLSGGMIVDVSLTPSPGYLPGVHRVFSSYLDEGIESRRNALIAVPPGSYALFVGPEAMSLAYGPQALVVFMGTCDVFLAILDQGDTTIILENAWISQSAEFQNNAIARSYQIFAHGTIFLQSLIATAGPSELDIMNDGGHAETSLMIFTDQAHWWRRGGAARVLIDPGVNVFRYANEGGPIAGPSYPSSQPVSYVVQLPVLPLVATDALAVTAQSNNEVTIESGFAVPVIADLIHMPREFLCTPHASP